MKLNKRCYLKLCTLFSITLLFSSCSAGNGGHPTPQEVTPEQMQKWQALGAPSDQHKVLTPIVGKWKAASSWRMSPAQPAQLSTASVTREWILGDRFVQERYVDPSKEHPFEGLGTIGYDNVLKEFSSTWIDTMSTATMKGSGSLDESGKIITFNSAGSCPMTGGVKEVRAELEIVSQDKNIYRMYDTGPDGKEFKMIEIIYTRAS